MVRCVQFTKAGVRCSKRVPCCASHAHAATKCTYVCWQHCKGLGPGCTFVTGTSCRETQATKRAAIDALNAGRGIVAGRKRVLPKRIGEPRRGSLARSPPRRKRTRRVSSLSPQRKRRRQQSPVRRRHAWRRQRGGSVPRKKLPGHRKRRARGRSQGRVPQRAPAAKARFGIYRQGRGGAEQAELRKALRYIKTWWNEICGNLGGDNPAEIRSFKRAVLNTAGIRRGASEVFIVAYNDSHGPDHDEIMGVVIGKRRNRAPGARGRVFEIDLLCSDQRKGRALMDTIEAYVGRTFPSFHTTYLVSVPDAVRFYQRSGYKKTMLRGHPQREPNTGNFYMTKQI